MLAWAAPHVVRDKDARVLGVVDGAVVELVPLAHVRGERVILALAVLADDDAHSEHVLGPAGVRARVLGRGRVRGVPCEVDALPEARRVLPA